MKEKEGGGERLGIIFLEVTGVSMWSPRNVQGHMEEAIGELRQAINRTVIALLHPQQE